MHALRSKGELLGFTEIAAIHGVPITRLRADHAYILYLHFQRQFYDLLERYSELNNDFSTPKQKRAAIRNGVNVFESVSVIMTLDQMGYRPDEYEKALKNITVLTLMEYRLLKSREAYYQHTYAKLMEESK